jgi:hypothetical protein
MAEIKSNRQLWEIDFPVGGEWDAGCTHTAQPGRWTVRRDPDHFVIVFHAFDSGQVIQLETFEPTEEGEISAKIAALAARDDGRRSP